MKVWLLILECEVKWDALLENWRKAMRNLDKVIKSRDIILPTKVHIVKAMIFPVVMYGGEKVKWKVLVIQSYQALGSPMYCSL